MSRYDRCPLCKSVDPDIKHMMYTPEEGEFECDDEWHEDKEPPHYVGCVCPDHFDESYEDT